MAKSAYYRLCRRYEQMAGMSLPEQRKYEKFIKNLYYLLTRTYRREIMPENPTSEDYKQYDEYCDTVADMLGVD